MLASASQVCPAARAARTTRSRARSRGWGLAGAAAALWLGEDGPIAGARIALGGVGEMPVRVDTDGLIGAEPGAEAFAAAGAAARDGGRRAARRPARVAEHRRHLAGVVVERALRAANARDRGRA